MYQKGASMYQKSMSTYQDPTNKVEAPGNYASEDNKMALVVDLSVRHVWKLKCLS